MNFANLWENGFIFSYLVLKLSWMIFFNLYGEIDSICSLYVKKVWLLFLSLEKQRETVKGEQKECTE